jgi:hypothetical protein
MFEKREVWERIEDYIAIYVISRDLDTDTITFSNQTFCNMALHSKIFTRRRPSQRPPRPRAGFHRCSKGDRNERQRAEGR